MPMTLFRPGGGSCPWRTRSPCPSLDLRLSRRLDVRLNGATAANERISWREGQTTGRTAKYQHRLSTRNRKWRAAQHSQYTPARFRCYCFFVCFFTFPSPHMISLCFSQQETQRRQHLQIRNRKNIPKQAQDEWLRQEEKKVIITSDWKQTIHWWFILHWASRYPGLLMHSRMICHFCHYTTSFVSTARCGLTGQLPTRTHHCTKEEEGKSNWFRANVSFNPLRFWVGTLKKVKEIKIFF